MAPLARLDSVTRRYGEVVALDDATIDVGEAEILGLLGPNGAGKTTVMSLLRGLIRPTEGRVELFGLDPRDHTARTALGVTPQETALPATLRVGEVVDFVGAHYPDRVSTTELAERFGFGDLLRRQTGALSGGQRRRLSVALAFAGRPRLVLLDEPTTGLDVDGRRELWDAIRSQRGLGATVVVTSHYLEEIEALAERVVVMSEGRIVADDSLGAILGKVGERWAVLESPRADEIATLPQVVGARIDGDRLELSLDDSDAFVHALVASGIPFSSLQLRGATLEEAFLSIVNGASR